MSCSHTPSRTSLLRKMKIIPLLFVGILFYIPNCAVSQQLQEQKIIPASPEASALAKFINYPVSYNTGIPNISIPLFEIKSGEIVLPISLNYHAGGIKVNEKSTWVGLGWQLSAEPEITRQINGNDDLGAQGYLNPNTLNRASDTTWRNPAELSTINYLKDMVAGNRDENPDEFYYKLNQKSGKFYFHRYSNGLFKPFPIPYEQIDITYNQDNAPFQVVDDDGTLYRFGKSLLNQQATETNNLLDYVNVTSWKCTEMISPSKKDTVFFTYTSPRSRFERNINEKYVVYDDEQVIIGLSSFIPSFLGDFGVYNTVAGTGQGIYHPELLHIVGSTDSVVLIKDENYRIHQADPAISMFEVKAIKINEITYRSGKVKFFLDNTMNQLDSIKNCNSIP